MLRRFSMWRELIRVTSGCPNKYGHNPQKVHLKTFFSLVVLEAPVKLNADRSFHVTVQMKDGINFQLTSCVILQNLSLTTREIYCRSDA